MAYKMKKKGSSKGSMTAKGVDTKVKTTYKSRYGGMTAKNVDVKVNPTYGSRYK